ncbi:MAG: hypothetical protein JXX14_01575 [Deltaproteobacteria bacterium]|nr:hypothetical protein [Deltaproteobacteria bacterium]
MRYYKFTFLILLALCTMGAGPCDDVKEVMDGSADDDSQSCDGADLNQVCNHSLDFDILLAGATEYPPGMYSFEIVAPDESVYVIDCQLLRADAAMDCTGPNLAQMVAGMDMQDYTKMRLHVNGAPPYCTLSVFYNDALLIEKTISPDYTMTYPNGENCEPVCYAGKEAVAVVIY